MSEISLSDLLDDNVVEATEVTPSVVDASSSKPQYGAVSVSDIAPPVDMNSEKVKVTNEVAKQITDAIDDKMEKVRETRQQIFEDIKENTITEDINAELDETDNTSNKAAINMSSTSTGVPYTDDEEDDDLFSLNDEDLSDMENELENEISSIDGNDDVLSDEHREILSNEIKKYINPVQNKIDLSTFSISNSSVNVAAAAKHLISSVVSKPAQVADYVLIDTGRVISMSAFNSDDLEKLNNAFYMRDSFNASIDKWQVFYDHCVDADKPITLEEWLRSISASDLPHMYAAAYAASFKGSNYIPYTCTNSECKKPYIPGETSFESLLKFKNETSRKTYKDILAGNRLSNSCLSPIRVQVSDDIVVDISKPSIYTAHIESVAIDPAIKKKYADMINFVLHISNIYIIDREAGCLKSIDYKIDVNDKSKTIKYKIVAYSKIIRTLNPDQKGIILGIISEFANNDDLITYVTPATTCTHCNHTNEEAPANIVELLFTRLRLTALTRLSTK